MRELPEGPVLRPVDVKIIRIDFLLFDDDVDYSYLIDQKGKVIFVNENHRYSVDIEDGPYRGNYLFHKDELKEILVNQDLVI